MWPSDEIVTAAGSRFLFTVERSGRIEDYVKYDDIRNAVWGDPDDYLSCPRNMTAENVWNEGGSLFIGVFREDEGGDFPRDGAHMAGFAYGFTGLIDKEIGYRDPANLVFYSQYAGVLPGIRNSGLGIRLKRFQARAVRDGLGISVISCTYDPLVGVNARRNIHHLGMEAAAYKTACYTGYSGHFNRLDIPTDRFKAVWDLDHPRPTADVDAADLLERGRLAVSSVLAEVEGLSGRRSLPLATEPIRPEGQDPLLVEIPFDFYAMLKETAVDDPEVRRIPLDWRLITRRVFLSLFESGWRVVDFCLLPDGDRKRDFYVLSR